MPVLNHAALEILTSKAVFSRRDVVTVAESFAAKMSTADHLDRGVKAGFSAIKEKMAAMSAHIKALQDKEKKCIEEKNAAKRKAHAAFIKMSELTMLTGEKEEVLRKKTEKLKHSVQRLDERSGHLTRLGEWNRSITQIPEEQLRKTEEEVNAVKTNYVVAKQKLLAARSKVGELEGKIERREGKFVDLARKEDQMRVQFEHSHKELELKQKREGKQVQAAKDIEQKYHETEQGYYGARRRHDAAAVRLKELEIKLSQTELILNEYRKKRVAMESTLRELLSSYSKGRGAQPAPRYPQAGTAVNSSTR